MGDPFPETDGTSQHMHIRGFIFMIYADRDDLMGSVLFLGLLQEGHNPNIQHLGRESWIRLPPQPEPKIATYLQSIIEVVLDFILCSFNPHMPS